MWAATDQHGRMHAWQPRVLDGRAVLLCLLIRTVVFSHTKLLKSYRRKTAADLQLLYVRTCIQQYRQHIAARGKGPIT